MTVSEIAEAKKRASEWESKFYEYQDKHSGAY